MIVIPQSSKDLVGKIVRVCTYAIEGRDKFPATMSFDDGFESIRQGLFHLREKLPLGLADQLLDMNAQAKLHFDKAETKLGAWLMQDMEQLLRKKEPFAYPDELYRWPRSEDLQQHI
jgi:hypothetical protein